jgi:putative oxygen-independent coproporphyrinogen III oxidase
VARLAAPGSCPRALYVHVPFCLSICPYCDFVVYAGADARGPRSKLDRFAAALHAELDLRADALDSTFGSVRPALSSVYLGGGTPSLMGPTRVAALLEHIDRRMGIAADAEITIEVNPGSDDRGDLVAFRSSGVDRVSIGAQSMVAAELRRLGRRHSPADVGETVHAARRAGFRSVSIDLLYDVPGQSVETWLATLLAITGLAPDHASAYALTLDDPDAEGLTGPAGDHLPLRSGARLWRERARAEQDEDRAAAMYEAAALHLAAAGFAGYELSNWARPGHECRHNLAYWRREPYEAIGPGAHAFDGVLVRRWNAAPLGSYLGALLPSSGPATLPPGGHERLSPIDTVAEEAILGLRLSDGIDDALAEHPAMRPGVAWARAHRLVEQVGARTRLTASGRLLSNEVFARLLPASVRVAA